MVLACRVFQSAVVCFGESKEKKSWGGSGVRKGSEMRRGGGLGKCKWLRL